MLWIINIDQHTYIMMEKVFHLFDGDFHTTYEVPTSWRAFFNVVSPEGLFHAPKLTKTTTTKTLRKALVVRAVVNLRRTSHIPCNTFPSLQFFIFPRVSVCDPLGSCRRLTLYMKRCQNINIDWLPAPPVNEFQVNSPHKCINSLGMYSLPVQVT